MIMIIKMIEIYNIAAQPYIGGEPMHTTLKQSHRIPHLRIYHLKEDALLPAIYSTHHAAVRINDCLKRTFVF